MRVLNHYLANRPNIYIYKTPHKTLYAFYPFSVISIPFFFYKPFVFKPQDIFHMNLSLWWAFFCNVGLGCLLLYWAQVFWVRELRPVQLQLTLVWLVHKLWLVSQELRSYAHDRRNYFRWVMASKHDDNNNKRKYFCL